MFTTVQHHFFFQQQHIHFWELRREAAGEECCAVLVWWRILAAQQSWLCFLFYDTSNILSWWKVCIAGRLFHAAIIDAVFGLALSYWHIQGLPLKRRHWMGADVAMKSVYRPLSINGPFPGGFFAFCHKDFGFLRSANHYIPFLFTFYTTSQLLIK